MRLESWALLVLLGRQNFLILWGCVRWQSGGEIWSSQWLSHPHEWKSRRRKSTKWTAEAEEGERAKERERETKVIFESPDLTWPNLLLKCPPDSLTLQFWESIHSSSFCSQFTLNSETHDTNWACLPEVISVFFFTSLGVHLSDLTQALCCLRTLSRVYFSWVRWTPFALCCTNHILLLLFVNICIAFTIFWALCD